MLHLRKRKPGEDKPLILTLAYQHLLEDEFEHILPFLKNKFGDSFVTIEDKNFCVTPWIANQVEEKYSDHWELRIARGMGKLHARTLFLKEQLGSAIKVTPLFSAQGLLKRWKSRLQEMNQYKQFAESRNLMSPIEQAFVKQYKYLTELGQRAIKYLKQWNEKMSNHQLHRTVLCHGHIHRKHVVHDQKQFYFVHFDQANLDTPVRDVALFLRRHLGKMLEKEEEYAMSWLEAYEKEFPLLKEEKLLLAIYLLFPERVFKEIEIYYQGIRDWHPVKQMKYFDKQIQLTHQARRFVRILLGQGLDD